ncbi:MAG: FtsQ-type POTRA domain-containing protein [Acetatifactor sp.]|nr:FtsQ-type POTRA domain-containing protein [Acetatifactor sp.]
MLVIKILIPVIVIAALAGAGVYVISTYTIQNVYVEGNVHYTEEEIQDYVMSGPLGNNSLYLSLYYKDREITNVPFVDGMDVNILSPDTIRISVYEKALAGYVKYLDTYMYFDKDGYVVESSNVMTMGVPQITGLSFDHVILGERLPVESTDVFEHIMDITNLLNKYQLTVDKIYFHSTGAVTIYFEDVKVALGNDYSHLEDKVMLLPEFLPNLKGKSGTLQMENYDNSNGKYTFNPN